MEVLVEVVKENYQKARVASPCCFFSTRVGAFCVGVFDVVVGLIGLSLLSLDRKERHRMLQPFQGERELGKLDEVGDTLQFLLEYWFPALSILVLGFIIITAVLTKKKGFVVFSFVLATVVLAGCVAGAASMLITRTASLGLLPFFILTALQFYFYWVIVEFSRYTWEITRADDKQNLVDSNV